MKPENTPEQNIKLINEMISQARNNHRKGSGSALISYGIMVAITAILNFILIKTLPEPSYAYWIWLIMIPFFAIQVFMGTRQEKQRGVITHLDRVVSGVWSAFSYSIVVLLIAIFGTILIVDNWLPALLITPIILTLTGLAQYATAVVCRFKPYYWGAIVFWISALLTLLCYYLKLYDMQFIVLAVGMVLGFILPGYMINLETNRDV